MTGERRSFYDRMRAASPMPPGSSPDYARFTGYFTVISILVAATVTYGLVLLVPAGLETAADWLADKAPIFKPRLAFFEIHDPMSRLSLTASILVFLGLFPIALLVVGIAYWRTFDKRLRCKKVEPMTLFVMIVSIFGATLFFSWVFVDAPKSYDPRWPGMARVLFWPIFPLLASGAPAICSILCFGALVGIAQFLFCNIGGKQ